MLRVPPAEWALLPQPQPFDYQVSYVLSFLAYMRDALELEPGTISTYLCGVKFMLEHSDVDVRFISESKAIKTTRTGMEVAFRAIEGNEKGDRSRKPMPSQMVIYMKTHVVKVQKVTGHAQAVAAEFALVCLARA